MVEAYVIACVVTAIFAIREITFVYREKAWNRYRDELRREHRLKETDLLNRILAETTHDYAALNNQAAAIEGEAFPRETKIVDDPADTVNDLLEKAGLGSDGYSGDGVSVI